MCLRHKVCISVSRPDGGKQSILKGSSCTMRARLLNFLFGVFVGNTYMGRAGVFALVAAFTCAVAFPLYPLVKQISKIGGDTWKE